jgi:hypothetical protein
MKKIIVLILLHFSVTVFSQEREATILFNDSTSVIGLGEIKKEKIYFRVSSSDEVSVWNYDMAQGLIFSGYGFSEKYVYVKPNKNSKPKLMEVIEEGKVNLYKESSFGLQVGIGPSVSNSNVGAGPNLYHDYSTVYYVKRKTEEYATDISFSFKSNSSRYFSDCDMLLQKIKKKEFRKKDIIKIVYFYNDYCGDEEED